VAVTVRKVTGVRGLVASEWWRVVVRAVCYVLTMTRLFLPVPPGDPPPPLPGGVLGREEGEDEEEEEARCSVVTLTAGRVVVGDPPCPDVTVVTMGSITAPSVLLHVPSRPATVTATPTHNNGQCHCTAKSHNNSYCHCIAKSRNNGQCHSIAKSRNNG
jgi:hypothetical protein